VIRRKKVRLTPYPSEILEEKKKFCTNLISLLENPFTRKTELRQKIIQAAQDFLVWEPPTPMELFARWVKGKHSVAIRIQSLARGYILRKNFCRHCGKIPDEYCDNEDDCENGCPRLCCVSGTYGYNTTQFNHFVLCDDCWYAEYRECSCCQNGLVDEWYDCEDCGDRFCLDDCIPENHEDFYINCDWWYHRVCVRCLEGNGGYFNCCICHSGLQSGYDKFTCEVCDQVFCDECLNEQYLHDHIVCKNCELDIDSDSDKEIEMWGNMQTREQQYKGAYVLQHNEFRKTAKLLPKFFDHKINQFLEAPEQCFICKPGSPYMTYMFHKDWNPGSSKAMIKPCEECDRKCHVVCFYQWRRYGNADYSPDKRCPDCEEFYEPNLLFLMGDKEKESTKPRGDPWHAYRADLAASKVSDIVAYRQWEKTYREE